MRHYVSNFLRHLAVILEFFIAATLAAGIILLCFRMATSLGQIPDLNVWPNYDDLLETCFNLIIGVELIRMVYYHTPNTVFEVLLFAIARQVIVDHASPVNSLIGVVAIAVLFATRKFLFCEFDISDEVIFRATSKVKTINKLLELNIPSEAGDTLGEILLSHLEKEEIEIGTGACVYFQDCGLRVAKMHDGKISRIEVIRSIH